MTKTLAVLGALAAVVAAALSGCTQERPDPIDIVVGVGFTADAPLPSFTPQLWEVFAQAAESNGDYQIVSGDGLPYVYDSNILGSDSDSAHVVDLEIEKTLATFGDRILGAIPVTPEANPLGTLDLASRGFTHEDRDRRILMISSGISTVDPLNHALGENLYLEPATVVADLTERGLVPDLTGITVYWSGLGGTVAPQTPLTTTARNNLVAVWTGIVEAGGGTMVVLDAPLPADVPSSVVPDLPDVSEAYVRPETSLIEPVRLLEDSIKFVADTGTYFDEPKAISVLRPIAETIIEQRLTVVLTGTTARQRSDAEQIATGLLRAGTVRDSLISLGVPPARISVDSVGSHWACYIEERNADGTIDEQLAQANRSIVISTAGQSIDELCA